MSDCQMCGIRHPGEPEECPEVRTGETILGKYQIGSLLGVGGMAAVYTAEHLMLRREIALKILHKRFAVDKELGSRFVREARETAAVGGTAFVGVHDAGTTDDGCAFIEMDRLDGKDLYTLRKTEGMLDPLRVTRIAIGVLGALEALHARRVIHRDLKSANVYLTPGLHGGPETVKILDLGFAKADDELKLTNRNQLLGTPFYISPEQYTDPTSVDARADLFSLGVVMFEVLTNKWPYSYKSKRELLAKVMKGELERHPAKLRPEIPGWLDLAVARALAHDRTKRFESAAEMRDMLEAGEAVPPPRSKPSFLKRILGRS
jgi:serine/threonine-protein kinase